MKIHGLNLGDAISVVRGDEVRQAYVQARGEQLVYCVRGEQPKWWQKRPIGKVEWSDEGKTWCRGWFGSAIEALKTVSALARSA